MATNGANTVEDADMSECDGEKVVTMMDVLQEQQDFEDDANAVLGASDDKNCTYTKGYIKRQAIYACMTCCIEAKHDSTKRAGVCLACSLNCHENHELIELYTKRNFRCDCGNPKFNSHPCTFTPDKTELNEDNKYNQNFSGLYCICHRPYPDPDSTVEDEMIQCIICEDWLHASHLDAVVPGNDQYSEMICKVCMEKNEFLHDYSKFTVNIETGDVEITVNGNTEITNGDLETKILENGIRSSEDNTEKSKDDMDVDVTETDNEPEHTDSKTVESDAAIEKDSPELKKPIDENKTNESSELPMEAEDAKQPSEANPDATKTDLIDESIEPSEESTNTTSEPTLEDNTSENKYDKPKEEASVNTEDSIPKYAESIKTVLPLEETTEDISLNKDIPELEKTKESDDKITENTEPSTTSQATSEIEAKGQINETISENKHAEETEKLESTDMDAKQEENSQASENVDKTTEANKGDKQINTRNDLKLNDINIKSTTENRETEQNSTEIESSDPGEQKLESNETLNDANVIEACESTKNKNEIHIESVTSGEETKESKRKLSNEGATEDILTKKPKLNEDNKCIRPKGIKKVYKGATFWPPNFRQKLCTCNECLSMYKDLSVLFLIDPEDTVTAYEALGKERIEGGPTTQYEKGLQALSSLDRIQQINALTEYNKMRDKLLDFLKSFKDRKEVVKEEDIKAFFAGMKPKREPDGVYFCR